MPPDKSVVVPIRLTGHVAARESFSELTVFQNRPHYAALFEYVIVDANERQYGPPITQEFFDKFNKNPIYQLVFAEENVFVFHRLGHLLTGVRFHLNEWEWVLCRAGPVSNLTRRSHQLDRNGFMIDLDRVYWHTSVGEERTKCVGDGCGGIHRISRRR